MNAAPRAGAAVHDAVRFEYVLRLADTSLILGQRLGEWVGHAPALEEDLGFGNLALDFIGQARLFLTYAGEIEGRGRTEDDLAFLRDGADFRNFTLVEQPNGDFGQTIVRQFFVDLYQTLLFDALAQSTDGRLAGIAGKAVKESQYHLRFSANWLVRLGDGTVESHRRVQEAAELLIRYTPEMFECDALEQSARAAGFAPEFSAVRDRWEGGVAETFREATLKVPVAQRGAPIGKRGDHSEHLGYMLAEMQFMQRAYPGASW